MDFGGAKKRNTIKNLSVTLQERQMALAMINEKTTLPPTVKDNKALLNST